MKVKDIVATLERFAPLPLQDDYDNAGLQVGCSEAEVSGALLCLDVTETVLEEAARLGCNFVVAHHPLLFKPLRHLTGQTYVERTVSYAAKHDIAIYAAHTNLDNTRGGVNFEIAAQLGLQNVEILLPKDNENGSGVVGMLPRPMEALPFLQLVKRTFEVESLFHNEILHRPIQRVALCGGAGDFLLPNAIEAQTDAFLTGEMHYHQYFGFEQTIQIAVLGHYQSEQFTKNLFERILKNEFPSLKILQTGINTNPIHYL